MKSIEKFGLSKRQGFLFNLMADGREMSLEDLTSRVCDFEGRSVARSSVRSSLNYIGAKVAVGGFLVQKTSGIGRGKKGRYKIVDAYHEK